MNLRYNITPQMKEYDRVGHKWLPYIMYFHTPGYSSETINTDSRGFRITHKGADKIIDISSTGDIPVGLIAGGSFAFGVGATSDANTIPSVLNTGSDHLWLNFGGRSFNSTQELLLFQLYRHKIKNLKKVVLLSGLNNLILHYLRPSYETDFGPFFQRSIFNRKMNGPRRSFFAPKKNIISCDSGGNEVLSRKRLIDIIERDLLNWQAMTESLGIEFVYVFQPFALWIDKRLSAEEERLFSELDRITRNTWRPVSANMTKPQSLWFLEGVKTVCHDNKIKFFDMNEAFSKRHLDDKWLYVDRVHCTDEGYRTVARILKEEAVIQ